MTDENVLDESMAVDKEARWNKLVSRCQKYASPLATRHQAKKIFKLVKKGKASKGLRMGVKDIQKSMRKGEKGILVLAGDVTPIDVISHLPLLCEKNLIPYCYVPSKEDLGSATGSKRQTCAILIKDHADYNKLYKECYQVVKEMPIPL